MSKSIRFITDALDHKFHEYLFLASLTFLSICWSGFASAENKCSEWEITLPKNIKIERAMFDAYVSRNLFIIGEGGNGVFLYDIPEKRLRQIYYARVVTDSVEQTSINTLRFELFYKRGVFAEIDIYQTQKMAKMSEAEDICHTKNGRLFCQMENQQREIFPFLGKPDIYRFSKDSNLLLFSNKGSGGYVYGTKTKEVAKLGFGEDFKFVNDYDIIFVNNSKVNDRCTNSYIHYWLNSAIDTFIVHREKDACIRYPDANKTDLIFIKNNKLFKCPLDLMNAVMER